MLCIRRNPPQGSKKGMNSYLKDDCFPISRVSNCSFSFSFQNSNTNSLLGFNVWNRNVKDLKWVIVMIIKQGELRFRKQVTLRQKEKLYADPGTRLQPPQHSYLDYLLGTHIYHICREKKIPKIPARIHVIQLNRKLIWDLRIRILPCNRKGSRLDW